MSLKEHLLPHFAWNRGFATQKSQGEYVAFFWLIVMWHCVLTAQLNAGQCVAWPAGPRLPVSGTGNFVLGKAILEILSNLREKANKVVIFSPYGPCFPCSSPRTVSCTELFSLIQFVFFHTSSTERNPLTAYILLSF